MLDRLELQLANLEENAAKAETVTQMAAHEDYGAIVRAPQAGCRPLHEHLQRERIVYPVPATCPCCGDSRLRKIGEDVTETLELVPRQSKVIQHVREKLVCRAGEAITQPPAPRTRLRAGVQGPAAGSSLLAKYGLHLPLHRQSDVYHREASASRSRRSRTRFRITPLSALTNYCLGIGSSKRRSRSLSATAWLRRLGQSCPLTPAHRGTAYRHRLRGRRLFA